MYLPEKSPPRSLGEMLNRPACPRANNNSRAGWKQMSNDDIDSLDADKRIDRVCDAFERSWLDRKKADIQPVLADVPEQYRNKLLLQLIGIDVEYRKRYGVPLGAKEYIIRFPELTGKC